VKLVPWLLPDDRGITRFECETCPAELELRDREAMHCGFLPQETWRPCELPPVMGARGHEVDLHELGVCPGWLTRQPAVLEATQACAVLRHGELRTFFPDEQNALLEGAMLAQQSFSLYELHKTKEAARR
jgi:hypothetical protein